jgi:hypothetical protein
MNRRFIHLVVLKQIAGNDKRIHSAVACNLERTPQSFKSDPPQFISLVTELLEAFAKLPVSTVEKFHDAITQDYPRQCKPRWIWSEVLLSSRRGSSS